VSQSPPKDVLDAYDLASAHLVAIHSGHINQSFRVDNENEKWILQRLNPIFSPELHDDVEVVTSHLAAQGMPTPHLVKNKEGRLWHRDKQSNVWRLQTYMEGQTHLRVSNEKLAFEAGALLGRFHQRLSTLDYTFKHKRDSVHDTNKHRDHLIHVLDNTHQHAALHDASEVGEEILNALSRLSLQDDLPSRIVHGDPKVSNMLFSSDNEGICMIDLDTLGHMPLHLELGDAFRSWCNLCSEDDPNSAFDIGRFESALKGYHSGMTSGITTLEKAMLLDAIERICLELAARFCADTLEESYFGWDRQRFTAAWQHQLLRSRAQLRLAQSLLQKKHQASQIVHRLLK
jgi:Ser/Thr protein kinase RdoA (MazF antagonist)